MFRDQFSCEPNEASLDYVDPTPPEQLTTQAPLLERGPWASLGPPGFFQVSQVRPDHSRSLSFHLG